MLPAVLMPAVEALAVALISVAVQKLFKVDDRYRSPDDS